MPGYEVIDRLCVMVKEVQTDALPNNSLFKLLVMKNILNNQNFELGFEDVNNITCLFGYADLCFRCKQGFYFSTMELRCVACPDKCSACRNSSFCTQCEENYKLFHDKMNRKIICGVKVDLFIFFISLQFIII
jgi:hypothetical protein